MTPGERVVVEAVLRWAPQLPSIQAEHALQDARNALLAERAEGPPDEVEITWGQVVEGDQIYRGPQGQAWTAGAPGGRWYEVTRAGLIGGGKARINARGIPRAIQPDAGKFVVVRRGVTGKAVDMFATVLWSMPTRPETVELPDEPESEV
jgi:hypothetical protein